MDCTICATEGRGIEASPPVAARRMRYLPGQARRARTASAPRARSRLVGRPLTRFQTCPANAGFRRSQMCFRCTKTSGRGMPPDPRTNIRAPCQPARRCPGSAACHRQPLGHRERAYNPFPWLDHPPRGCRVPLPEVRNRGYSYPSGGRVRALQAILWPRIPPDHPQNAQNRRESGFPGFDTAPGAPGPPGRPGTRPRADPDGLAGRDPARIASAGPSATKGKRSAAARRRAGKPRGQRGRGPPPASAGDARSVAPSKLAPGH